MTGKITMERITRRMAEAEAALEDLMSSMVRARVALESYDAEVRETIPAELLEASKASYDVAHHLDRGMELWEDDELRQLEGRGSI